MARTPNASKHPALMMHSQNGLEKVSKETGKGKISDLPYWKDLSGPEQVFLSNYLFYRDAALAAKIQGKELDWVTDRCKKQEGFQEVMDYVMDYPRELARAIAEEALPKSMQRLKTIVDTSDSEQNVIRASKELRESTLSLGDTPWFSNGASTMNNIFIQPFDARQEPDNIIEAS